MHRFRTIQPFLLKTSFLFALLVIHFLLFSGLLQTPQNIPLANFIQNINSILSWPVIVVQELVRKELPWYVLAFCIVVFWFIIFYSILHFAAMLKGKLYKKLPG